jgi:hypothetical protein
MGILCRHVDLIIFVGVMELSLFSVPVCRHGSIFIMDMFIFPHCLQYVIICLRIFISGILHCFYQCGGRGVCERAHLVV